ncbi:fumarylacetoacetate hydrolase family protein [Maribacter algicola]|uniref:Fumarylacetoacetate hydrolase family protein n=1 Tax=Meishania litoralis TaxID=3434685 RepID=A0ACC7LKG6_9FLAO
MRIFKIENGAVVENEGNYYQFENVDWNAFINRKGLYKSIIRDLSGQKPMNGFDVENHMVAPVGGQEIWASGVTYMRSKQARMEESKDAGGGTFYDKVYDADRPELFFKATPHRTVGNLGEVRIRKDSHWDVPEPELTLFITSKGTIEGYTIGNDMSSRSIEGENPLYLPQAKTYDACAGLGPCIYISEKEIAPDTLIRLEIKRNGNTAFEGEIPISNMKRNHQELVDYLFRECSFPYGVFLMTGTGIIPPDEFTLQSKDEIRITIGPIGTLVNFVQ